MQDINHLPQIFIIGSTGFIGGNLLDELANGKETHKLLDPSKYKLVLLSRTQENKSLSTETYSSKFAQLEIHIGDFDSLDLLQELAEKSDIIINVSYSDDLPSVKALVRGIEKGNGFLVQTSGSGALVDWAIGEHGPKQTYSDLDQASIRCTEQTKTRPHGIVDAYLQDIPNAIIIMPPEVYGVGRGLIRKISFQVPAFIKIAQKFGFAMYLGQGLNQWSNIHVSDLSNAYIFIIHRLLSKSINVKKDLEGYVFVENGNELETHKDFSVALAQSLYEKGLLSSNEPQTAPKEIVALDRKGMMGGNSVIKADRLRNLGWKPSSRFERRNSKRSIEVEVNEAINSDKDYAPRVQV